MCLLKLFSTFAARHIGLATATYYSSASYRDP
jgi:hypothetical protein